MAASLWAAVLAAPSPSPTPNPCDQMVQPTDSASFLGRLGCDVAPQVGQAIGGVAGQIGQAAAGAAETDFNAWVANGAAWMVRNVAQLLTGSSSTPSLDPTQAASFAFVYGRVVGVALSLSVLLALIGIIEATLTRRPGGLRRVVIGMAVSGIGLGAVPVGTAVLVRITDDLSGYVAGQAEGVASGFGQIVSALVLQPGSGSSQAVAALVSIGLIGGGAMLWLELVVRASLIYVFLGVAPLACAAVQWPRLEGVLRQVLFGGLALIVSKLVVVIVLAVGFAVLPAGGGLLGLLGGMFIVGIAALSPFATARVLPLAAEEMAIGHQGRIRGWVVSGVGGSARLVSSLSTFGSASQVRPVRPMGGSGPSQQPRADQAGPGPTRPAMRPSVAEPGPVAARPAAGRPPRRPAR
jgi:type IV secretion system protein TrbL